jgi:phosphohistidine phosphatase
MREILLVRHGKAVEYAPGGDAARPLTDEGQRAVAAVGGALKRLNLLPDAVWHSPYVRATETAQLLHGALGARGTLKVEGALAPGSSPERTARLLLDAKEQRLLVVSHMPLLPALAVELIGARVEFGTATVAHVIALGPHGSTLAGLWSADVLAHVR